MGTVTDESSNWVAKPVYFNGAAEVPPHTRPRCEPGQETLDDLRCHPCQPGYSESNYGIQTRCEACLPGTFSNAIGQTACQPCAAGEYSEPVEAGEGGPTKCLPCPVGTHNKVAAASQCIACEEGRFAGATGTKVCDRCFLGYYSDQTGQSECEYCAEGKKNTKTWTTMRAVRGPSGQEQMTYYEGAKSNATCGCDKGHIQNAEGECVECVEGMLCNGLDDVTIEKGYAWDGDIGTYRCYGDLQRCPGGEPGVCADGRDTSTVACSECLKGKVAKAGGACVDCDGGDAAPFALFCLAVPCIIVGMYFGLERAADKRINASMPHLLLMMCATMLATLIQQLMVIGLLHLEWKAPMTYLFEFFQLLIFDIDILNVGCIFESTSAGRFTLRMFLLYVAIAFLWMVHAFAVFFVWKGGLKKNNYRLIRSVGTIMAFFYISVVSSVMVPFNCTGHPNGDKTLVSDTAVLCGADDGAHSQMIAVGMVACLLPLFFLTTVVYVAYKFPEKMLQGDTAFLYSWNFLFMRFKTDAYWYPAVVMVRNTMITFAPLLAGAVTQVTALAILMMGSLWVCIFYMPWRIKMGNVIDVFCHLIVNVVLLLCAFFVKERDDELISQVCFAFIIIALCSVGGALAFACSKRCIKELKQFQFFLCHHKAGAGAFARLLKVCLLKNKKVTRKVFMDSDDLQDLDLLFGYVCSHSENFVLIVSPELVKRPWCMGELVTAWSNGVQTIPVLTHGGSMPTEKFIENYDSHVPDIDKIYKFGMNLEMVQEALRHMVTFAPTSIRMEKVNANWMEYACTLIVSQGVTTQSSVRAIAPMPDAPESSGNGMVHKNTVVLVDHSNPEGVSTALFLKEVIMPLIFHEPTKIPYILPPGEALPSQAHDLVLILTNGLFAQRDVLNALLAASQGSNTVLPVLTDENFRFPTADLQDDTSAVMMAVATYGKQKDTLVDVINQCFQEIAIVFQPQLYSTTESVIAAKAQEVVKRLMKADRGGLKQSQSSSKGKDADVQLISVVPGGVQGA